MSDYPERISISPVHRQKHDDDFYLVDRKAFPGKGTEYVRADRIEELEAKAIANRVAIMRLEAKLTKAMDALAGVDQFVRDLSPFADPSHSPATALAKACEVYAELTGGKHD